MNAPSADASGQRASVDYRAGPHPWNRYVALGDSFTEGVGDPEPRSPGGLRDWADRAAEELSVGHEDFAYAKPGSAETVAAADPGSADCPGAGPEARSHHSQRRRQ